MYSCSVCNLAVIVIPPKDGGESKVVRVCPHKDAAIVANASAKLTGVGSFERDTQK